MRACGRHLEGAELHQALAAAGAVRRVELVDAELGAVGVAGDVHQQVAQHPVDDPGLLLARLALGHLLEGDGQLVEAVVAGLVDPRGLAGGADEGAGEQVRQARVVLPVGDQALHQVRAAQQRAVRRGRAAEGDVVAAAGAGVATVEHELLGAEAGLAGLLVEDLVSRTSSSQLEAGCTLTSMTPGSGVTASFCSRWSAAARSPRR
jgi:hypothetical protein